MEKRIAAFEARRNFGKVLRDVTTKGDRFLIERHGEPVAAVVSIEIYNQWKKARDDFFASIRAAQACADLSPEAADDLAVEAVGAARSRP